MVVPLILLVISLLIIGYIVVRKLPQLSLLDIESIPEVKQQKTKETLLRKRAQKQTEKVSNKTKQGIRPVVNFFRHMQRDFRNYVSKVQRKVHTESERLKRQKPDAIADVPQEKYVPAPKDVPVHTASASVEQYELLNQAKSALEEESYVEAEKLCIATIKRDPTLVEAYEVLAQVYLAQKQITEAEQTYEFILQLDPRSEQAYVRLGEIAEERGEFHKAVDCYQEALLINDNVSSRYARIYELLMKMQEFDTALEAAKQAASLEPDNPRYLDNLVEASIIVGDKKLAESAYERLRMVNPENKKLEAFKQRIKAVR